MSNKVYSCSISDVNLRHTSQTGKPILNLVLSMIRSERHNIISSKINVCVSNVFVYDSIDSELMNKLKVFFIGKVVAIKRVGKGKQHWEILEDDLRRLYEEFEGV